MHKVRFDLLDGLRGIAAISVMIYHYTQHNGLHWFGGAWVAVDLFFILSGFVIAHSYGDKITGGMSFRRFALARLIRLGPLYFLGMSLGILAIILLLYSNRGFDLSKSQITLASLLGFAWIPYLNNASWPFGADVIIAPIFPLNNPAWSLFFELVINAVFFFYVRRFRKVPQVKTVLFGVVCYVTFTILFHQINPGWGAANFVFGFPRVFAAFFGGTLIYALGYHLKHYPVSLIVAIGLAAFIVFLINNGKIAFLNSITFVPFAVLLMSSVRVDGAWRWICKVLGDISYPIYVIHFPIYNLAFRIFDITKLNPIVQVLAIGSACIVISVVLVKLDFAVRERITNKVFERSDLLPESRTTQS